MTNTYKVNFVTFIEYLWQWLPNAQMQICATLSGLETEHPQHSLGEKEENYRQNPSSKFGSN